MTFIRKVRAVFLYALFLAVLITFSVSGFSNSVQADQQPLFSDESKLDGKIYAGNALLSQFVNVSLSASIRPNSSPHWITFPPHSPCPRAQPDTAFPFDEHSCANPAEFKSRYPWIYEYLYRDHGFPRYLAINKWLTPIRISLGYSNDLLPATAHIGGPHQSSAVDSLNSDLGLVLSDPTARPLPSPDKLPGETPGAVKLVADEIQNDIPVLKDQTGLAVSYISHDQEEKNSPANLRIVLVSNPFFWKAPFKRQAATPLGFGASPPTEVRRLRPPPNLLDFNDDVEPHLLSAVRFTPYSGQQVDGFLLPNADNSVGMAFCFIRTDSAPQMIQAMVRECLVRSLGLPSSSSGSPEPVGSWHPNLLQQWNDSRPNGAVLPAITEFDRLMIRTLYNPAVKPGMSIDDIYKVANP